MASGRKKNHNIEIFTPENVFTYRISPKLSPHQLQHSWLVRCAGPVQIDCKVQIQILVRLRDFMRLIEVMMRAATGTNEDFTGEIKDEDMWDSEQSW